MCIGKTGHKEPETTIARLGCLAWDAAPVRVCCPFFSLFSVFFFLYRALHPGSNSSSSFVFFFISLLNWIKKATVINAQGQVAHSRRGSRLWVVLPKSNAKPCLPHMWQRLPCYLPFLLSLIPLHISYLGKILATTQGTQRLTVKKKEGRTKKTIRSSSQGKKQHNKDTHTHTHASRTRTRDIKN